jgi:hypothetical protein
VTLAYESSLEKMALAAFNAVTALVFDAASCAPLRIPR